MGYKLWMSSINDIQGNPDAWRMFSEDLEPKGGILSRRRKGQNYLGIREEIPGGVEGIVLRKGGDVGRRGGSGQRVAV
jgi:hypothetical protein